jgi:hypothetical protein
VSALIVVYDVNLLMVWILTAKKRRVADCTKMLLDIAKESADWFGPLKAVLGGVNALIKHYEVSVESTTFTHNSHRCSQEFEDVKEKIEELVPQLDTVKQTIAATIADEDPEETDRRMGLIRYVR